jgi:hypothetical protein
VPTSACCAPLRIYLLFLRRPRNPLLTGDAEGSRYRHARDTKQQLVASILIAKLARGCIGKTVDLVSKALLPNSEVVDENVSGRFTIALLVGKDAAMRGGMIYGNRRAA